MTRDFSFVEMRDDPDVAYVISIPEQTSQRYAEVVQDRFQAMFDEAEITITTAVLGSNSMEVEQMDHEDFREEYKAVEEAEDDD